MERTFTARDEASLRTDLEQQGLYLFQVRRSLGAADLGLKRRRIPNTTLMIFGQELAALLKAGLPLFQSLDIMLERQPDPAFRRSLTSVREKVMGGTSLSDAFKGEGELYPPMFAASLVAGERSGSLETVLRRFVQYLRLTQALKKRAVAAAIYPMFLLAMMLGLVTILVVLVIPQFRQFYEGLGAELPLVTRVLVAVAGFVRGNLVPIAAAAAGAALLTWGWLRGEGSGLVIDRALLRLPYVGPMMRMYATAQLARTLSTLLTGGLPLLNAIEVAAQSVGNRAMGASVVAAAPLIREGKSLTVALESTAMFDNLPLEMVKVGEQTGALHEMLNSIAEFYDEELDARLGTALALVEPVMLALMAIIVAGMLLAFYLPLFQVFSVIK